MLKHNTSMGMGRLLLLLLVASGFELGVSAKDTISLSDAQELLYNFARGLFEGFRVQDDISALKGCMQNADKIWGDLKVTVGYLRSLNYIWDHFGELIADISLPLLSLMADLNPCINSGSALGKAASVLQLLNPKLLTLQTLKVVVMHSPYLIRELHDMYRAMMEQDAHRLGYDLGDFWFTLLFNEYAILP